MKKNGVYTLGRFQGPTIKLETESVAEIGSLYQPSMLVVVIEILEGFSQLCGQILRGFLQPFRKWL